MSRLQNAPAFELQSLEGNYIDEIFAASDSGSNRFIEMLFLNLVGEDKWHRIFLDAGIGFWEKMSREKAFYDFEDCCLIDYSKRWKLNGAKIISAQCIGETWDDFTSSASGEVLVSSFQFVMDIGTINFAYAESHNMESETLIHFIPE